MKTSKKIFYWGMLPTMGVSMLSNKLGLSPTCDNILFLSAVASFTAALSMSILEMVRDGVKTIIAERVSDELEIELKKRATIRIPLLSDDVGLK